MKKTNLKNQSPYIVSYTLFLIFVTVTYMLLFAYNNSPLTERLGEDGSIYLLMGKGLTQGKTLYTDLFDHKGPLIFFFNALPQLFVNGAIGVWCLEVVWMVACELLLFRLAYKKINDNRAVFVPLVFLWLSVISFDGGNYTEEFCNLCSIAALYIFTLWADKRELLPRGHAYLLGLMIAFGFFMRPNNIAIPAAVTLFIGIYTLCRTPHRIFKYLLYGTLGILTITLPIILYCVISGNLVEMMNATLLHNLKYCQTGVADFHVLPKSGASHYITFATIALLQLTAICTCISREEYLYCKFLLLCNAVVFAAVVIGGRAYMHYWTLMAPLSAFSLFVLLKPRTKRNKQKKRLYILPLVLFLCCTCAHGYITTGFVQKGEVIREYKHDAQLLYECIPPAERDDFFAYDMPAIWLYTVGAETPCRYFTMQRWMALTDPSISQVIQNYMQEERPKWVLSYYKETGENGLLYNELHTKYQEVKHYKNAYLYQRMDEKE